MQLTYHDHAYIPNVNGFLALDQGFWTIGSNGNKSYKYTFSDLDDIANKITELPDVFRFASMDNKPAVVLKTQRIQTAGDVNKIPKTSDELTSGGTWKNYDPKGDTLFLVTYTVDPTVRSETPDGYQNERLTDIALRHYLNEVLDSVEFCITYSPDIEAAIKMHKRHRAEEIGIVLKQARSGLYIAGKPAEDVRPMGYKWPGIAR